MIMISARKQYFHLWFLKRTFTQKGERKGEQVQDEIFTAF